MRAGHTTCNGVQYFSVLQDHNRTLTVHMREGPADSTVPTLIQGTAPFAFAYVQPTVMVFPTSTKCNGPVGDPINAGIDQQSDSDGYYAYVYPGGGLPRNQPFVIAVRLTNSHGGYDYIRVPLDFGGAAYSWPPVGQFNVTEDVIDYVADKPEDTLLCPRLYKTEVH